MRARTTRLLAVTAVLAAVAVTGAGSGASALSTVAGGAEARAGVARAFVDRVFASGATITHRLSHGREAISGPDDITYLGDHIFVGFQNGVGPQGQASASGNRNSTVVEFGLDGRAVAQWEVTGKCDGLTADRALDRVIATVNEDANSSLYLIRPGAGANAVRYRYDRTLPSHGGTDAISVYDGMILISASAPGTIGAAAPQRTYPAVYRVSLDAATRVAGVRALFYDRARAKVANTDRSRRGTELNLALTDPDSNEAVPAFAPRFAGEFMLTSQGDKQQIYVRDAGSAHPLLSVLALSDSVDDTVWASDSTGAIYTTDNAKDTVDRITGPFARGSVFVADTPCDAADAPSTCPAAGFPANYLGRLNPFTGVITRIALHGASVEPQGMLFLP